MKANGRGERTRTSDLVVPNDARYLLRHAPTESASYSPAAAQSNGGGIRGIRSVPKEPRRPLMQSRIGQLPLRDDHIIAAAAASAQGGCPRSSPIPGELSTAHPRSAADADPPPARGAIRQVMPRNRPSWLPRSARGGRGHLAAEIARMLADSATPRRRRSESSPRGAEAPRAPAVPRGARPRFRRRLAAGPARADPRHRRPVRTSSPARAPRCATAPATRC